MERIVCYGKMLVTRDLEKSGKIEQIENGDCEYS
jgi:hypothetical protein